MKPTFQRIFLNLSLIAASLALSGCVVSVGSRVQAPPPAPPPPTVVVGDPGQAATIAEIDAAAHFNMDSSRTHALGQIAERPNLAPPVQVHLINTAYHRLQFDSSKVQILQKMIARPFFCDTTRHAIVSQLARLGFESSKQDLLNRINQRMAQAAPAAQ
jgi:hypothetical protein